MDRQARLLAVRQRRSDLIQRRQRAAGSSGFASGVRMDKCRWRIVPLGSRRTPSMARRVRVRGQRGTPMSERQDPNKRNRQVLEIVATAKWITHRQLSEIANILGL